MLTIGEVASRAGLRPSAIRYYEELGLLPAPPRKAGKRIYDAAVLDRLALIDLAKAAGFSLDEIRALLSDLHLPRPASASWRKRADAKHAELDEQITKATRMQQVLSMLTGCQCATLADCGRVVNAVRKRVRT
jgi:MerR family redox-sensitive transcriptional activator SoxR